ncbi:MAG: cupin domain-containing protein [Solirubrobacteraceae bacterium]
MPNINEPVFDEPREHEGFMARRARLSRQAGAERLGVSLWELAAGQAAYPYHFHYTEEELLLVLEGWPSLRTPAGWRELAPGELVSFRRGEQGAHQVLNRSAESVRFLSFSSSGDPDVVMYPDSGKLGAFERLPGGGGLGALFRLAEAVDYYDGERPPGSEG